MNFEEFWENYLNKDITTISDLTIDFFNQPFAKNIKEEYDLGEIITEFIGHHETAKKFDKIEAFGEVIKNQHPTLYATEGDFFHTALIQYYCFVNDTQKLNLQIEDFLSRAYDYDMLLQSFNQLLYNQHIELVNKVIEREYENVQNSSELLEGAEFDLAIIKYYIELEKLYLTQKDNSNSKIEFSAFKEVTSRYGFNFNDQYCNHIEIGLFNNSEDAFQDLLGEFPDNRTYIMAALEMQFLLLMQTKNCPFTTAGKIWYHLLLFFENKNAKKWSNYFSFNARQFNEFIQSKSGFFIDNGMEIAVIIWGSSHLMDFIYQKQIISNDQYIAQKKLIEKQKNDFKKKHKFSLWEFNAVHKWQPDELTSLEDWKAENDEFESSYNLEPDTNQFDDKAWGAFIEEASALKDISDSLHEPNVNTRKIGRNEKISVKYNDGTIKQDIKYKKVMNDVKDGKCEIL